MKTAPSCRTVLFLVLAWLPSAIQALPTDGRQYTVLPERPSEITPVRIRVQTQGCQVLPSSVIVRRDGNAIHAEIDLTDECFPNLPPQERTYTLGTFQAGNYVLHHDICGWAPFLPGGRGCYEDISTILSVGNFASETRPIPANGMGGLIGLIVIVVLAAMRHVFGGAADETRGAF